MHKNSGISVSRNETIMMRRIRFQHHSEKNQIAITIGVKVLQFFVSKFQYWLLASWNHKMIHLYWYWKIQCQDLYFFLKNNQYRRSNLFLKLILVVVFLVVSLVSIMESSKQSKIKMEQMTKRVKGKLRRG